LEIQPSCGNLGASERREIMFFISEKIERFAVSASHCPSEACEEIANYTKQHVPMSIMLTGPLEAGLLGFLIRSLGAKRVLEVGTYTGYSALAMAECLPADGQVVTLDRNPETTALAQQFWDKSPDGKKIEARVGVALEILPTLSGTFDFAFIDADKVNYENYLNGVLRLLSPRGIVAVDNTLYSGMVLEDNPADPNAQAIKRFDEAIKARKDLWASLIPIRDGLTLIQRR